MPTLGECPLNPSPRPEILVAALILRPTRPAQGTAGGDVAERELLADAVELELAELRVQAAVAGVLLALPGIAIDDGDQFSSPIRTKPHMYGLPTEERPDG